MKRLESMGYRDPASVLGSVLVFGLLTFPTIAPLAISLVDMRPSLLNTSCAILTPQDYTRYLLQFEKQAASSVQALTGTAFASGAAYYFSTAEPGC